MSCWYWFRSKFIFPAHLLPSKGSVNPPLCAPMDAQGMYDTRHHVTRWEPVSLCKGECRYLVKWLRRLSRKTVYSLAVWLPNWHPIVLLVLGSWLLGSTSIKWRVLLLLCALTNLTVCSGPLVLRSRNQHIGLRPIEMQKTLVWPWVCLFCWLCRSNWKTCVYNLPCSVLVFFYGCFLDS